MPARRSLEAFVAATSSVFKTTLKADLRVEHWETRAPLEMFTYSASIPLAGQVGGIFLISMSPEIAQTVCRAFVGDDAPCDGVDDLLDSVGEMANMVAGSAKTLLLETPSRFDMTLPVTYQGTGLNARTSMPGGWARCSIDGEPLLCAVWRARSD